MELKKGYKQTEVGVIPEDWDLVSVKSITKFHKQGYYTTEKYQNNGEYYLLRGTDMQNPNIDLSTTPRINAALNDYEAYKVLNGDFLFVRSGAIGRYGIVNEHTPKSIFGSYLINFRFIEKLNTLFFGYFYQSNLAIKQLAGITQGGGNLNINAENIKALVIPLPPTMQEQTAIATALSDVDALITNIEKLLTKKRNIKQGAMQQLLQPKKGWEVKKLGELGECIIGLTYKPENVKESGILVLRSSNIQEGVLSYENNVFVDCEVQEKLINRENDILICVRNGSRNLIGKCALIKGQAIGQTFGAFMSVFRSPFNAYVFVLFQSDIIKKQIDEHLGATINQITNKSLNSFEIPFPPIEEQTQIATILSDMDAEINALETKLYKYQQLKQGMMQNLLTGKIRLI